MQTISDWVISFLVQLLQHYFCLLLIKKETQDKQTKNTRLACQMNLTFFAPNTALTTGLVIISDNFQNILFHDFLLSTGIIFPPNSTI